MSELSLASAQVLSSVVSDASYPQGLLAWNMLVNAGIPAVLVDARLAVKFVTPAAASLLKLGDAEKELPLESFQGIIRDPALLADAQHVLREQAPVERVIALQQDRWYLRRMAPYRTTAMSCDGVVVILTDITDRERVARSLKSGKQQAEMASAANMRRLSAVCHDLRQPLNTLGLIGGLLAQSFRDPLVQRLAQLLDDSLQAMSGMLSSAHYACRLSAGSVRPDHSVFPIEDVFARLRREFFYHSGAYGLKLRIAPSSLCLRSDSALCEQMIRSLLEHLVKTTSGKLLLGCRRTADFARIEFWRSKRLPQRRVPDEDAAQGAAGSEIAKKLADLLGCRLRISLDPRRPVFTLEIPLGAPQDATMPDAEAASAMRDRPIEPGAAADAATVFIVDDDDDVLTSVQHILQRPGLSIATYTSAEAFLASFVPNNHSCLLVDAHLAGMQGIELIRQLNAMGHRPPTIVISGRADIAVAVEAMKAGAVDFVEKPLNSSSLRVAVERALTQARHQHETTTERQEILGNLAKLSTRQRQVLHLMLEGKSSKTIAAQLFMSQRTVESHRANVMKKMNTKSLPELARKVSVVRSDASSGAHPAPDFDPLLSKP